VILIGRTYYEDIKKLEHVAGNPKLNPFDKGSWSENWYWFWNYNDGMRRI
jgi:hypothetical protein